MLRRALLVSAGVAAAAWLLAGATGRPGYDAAFALDAAAQLTAGRETGYAASALAPVAHPGVLLLALVAAPLGAGVLTGALALGFGLLVWAAGELGGVLAGLVVLTSPAMLEVGVLGLADVPAAGLALAAVVAAREKRPARPAVVLGLLAGAGLFRPEAWLLAGAAWLWLGRPRGVPLALVVAPPVLWLGMDLLLTGDPLRSFGSIAAHTARVGNGPTADAIVRSLGALEPWPVWAGAVAGGVVAWRRAPRATALVLAAAGLWLVALLVPALGGATPVQRRFLLLPAAAVAAGWGVAARARRPPAGAPRPRATRLVPGLLLVGLTLAIAGPARVRGIEDVRAAEHARAGELDRLDAFLARPAVTRLLARRACRPVATPGFGFRPYLRRRLGIPPRDVAFAYAGGAPARGSVLLPTAPRSAVLGARGRQVRGRTVADPAFRRRFARAAAGGGWELWTPRSCR